LLDHKEVICDRVLEILFTYLTSFKEMKLDKSFLINFRVVLFDKNDTVITNPRAHIILGGNKVTT
jgi:hypothetical protein